MSGTSHVESFERRYLFAAVAPPMTPEKLVPGDAVAALTVAGPHKPAFAAGARGVSLAVWQAGGDAMRYDGIGVGTMADVYAARVDAAGTVIDRTAIPISIADYNQTNPQVAWNGRHWLVAWQSERANDRNEQDVYAVRVDAGGRVVDARPVVIGSRLTVPNSSDDIDPTGPLQVVSNGDDWFVTWRRHNLFVESNVGMEWFVTRVAADGTAAQPGGRRYLAATQFHADLGFAYSPAGGGTFLHAYAGNGAVVLRRFDRDMNELPGQQTFPVTDTREAAVAGSPAGWVVAWVDQGAVNAARAVRVGADGVAIDAEPVEVAPPTTLTDRKIDAEWDGGRWAVCYSDDVDADLFVRRLHPDAPAAEALTPAARVVGGPGKQSRPRLVAPAGAGEINVLFEDSVSARPGVAVAAVSGADELLARNDAALAAPSHGTPELTSDGRNFLAVFSSSTAYGTRLLAERLGPDGRPLDAEPLFIADPSVPGDPRHRLGSYEVAFLGGRYVVAYTVETPHGRAVYARQVGADGTIVGGAVEMAPEMDAGDLSVMHRPGGDRMILVGIRLDGPQRQWRYARLFDESLAPITEPFNIGGDYTMGLFALGGETVVVGDRWLSTWSQKPTHDRPRRFAAYTFIGPDGDRTAATLLPGTYVDDDVPTVVSNGGESATEAMIAFAQGYSIVGYRFAADGAPIGGPMTLIDEPGRQAEVRSVFDGRNYVLSWTDQRNSPFPAQPRDDVFAARVRPDGTVLDAGGFPVADDARPELGSAVAVNSTGAVVFAYRSFREEAPYGSFRLATRRTAAGAQSGNAPRVVGVWAGGSGWAPLFRGALAASYQGTIEGGYALSGTTGTGNILPWTNVDRISIRFDSDVTIDADDLAVRGSRVGAYTMNAAAFHYDAATRTATWALVRPLRADKVVIELDADLGGVAGANSGVALDGEWDAATAADGFPSGDGAAGGDFRFRGDVLPGDVTRNGHVDTLDYLRAGARLFTDPDTPGVGSRVYSTLHDLNGDARIDGMDLAHVRSRMRTTLPAAEPPPAPAGVFGDAPVRRRPPTRGVLDEGSTETL